MTAWDDAVDAAARTHFERIGIGVSEWSDTSSFSQELYRRDSAAELREALHHLLAPIYSLASELAVQVTQADDPDIEEAYRVADREASRRLNAVLDQIKEEALKGTAKQTVPEDVKQDAEEFLQGLREDRGSLSDGI